MKNDKTLFSKEKERKGGVKMALEFCWFFFHSTSRTIPFLVLNLADFDDNPCSISYEKKF